MSARRLSSAPKAQLFALQPATTPPLTAKISRNQWHKSAQTISQSIMFRKRTPTLPRWQDINIELSLYLNSRLQRSNSSCNKKNNQHPLSFLLSLHLSLYPASHPRYLSLAGHLSTSYIFLKSGKKSHYLTPYKYYHCLHPISLHSLR